MQPYEDGVPEKKYTYSQLIELNDKLTLVVGKGEDQQCIIRCFSDVICDFIERETKFD